MFDEAFLMLEIRDEIDLYRYIWNELGVIAASCRYRAVDMQLIFY